MEQRVAAALNTGEFDADADVEVCMFSRVKIVAFELMHVTVLAGIEAVWQHPSQVMALLLSLVLAWREISHAPRCPFCGYVKEIMFSDNRDR